jgi:hypothetical protein
VAPFFLRGAHDAHLPLFVRPRDVKNRGMRERVGSLEAERVSAWEWAQTALLAANLVWTTLCLGGYRPETMAVTLALTGLLLAVHCAARAVDNRAVGAEIVPPGASFHFWSTR